MCICLMYIALNDLGIKSADIFNAYLNTKCKEKVNVTVGSELVGKESEGKTAIIPNNYDMNHLLMTLMYTSRPFKSSTDQNTTYI